jgi:signal transduction histidine kinase
MRSLRVRLIVSHVLPLLVVVPLVGVALTYLLETQVLLAGLSNELERQGALVAAVAADYPAIWVDPRQTQAFAARISEQLAGEVMFLDTAGVLLASTDPADAEQVGERLSLPGLREVLLTGSEVRVDYGERPGTGAAEVLVPVFLGGRLGGPLLGVVRLTDPLASVYERFPRTRTFIVWVLVAGLAVGASVGLVLALDLERPLRGATRSIARMADGGPLAVLPEEGPREVRSLVRAFNTLTQQLEDMERARKRLLANLVHELGRPLGALLSAVQALSGGADSDPVTRSELLNGMEAEVGRMRGLVDQLTHLYDQTLGPLELEREEVSIAAWLPEVLAPWREAAQAKGLHWQMELPADLPSLDIDPDRLAQAIGNVVSNAIKYTSQGGAVAVSAGTGTADVWVRVGDTGPGIPPEEQAQIFSPFYRGSAGRRFPQGMGLGLSITQDVVTAHGGRVDVDSALGAGSTFTLWLPRT